MKYIIMRLNTGEQVMATLESEESSHYHVTHPMVVNMTQIVQEEDESEQIEPTIVKGNDTIH